MDGAGKEERGGKTSAQRRAALAASKSFVSCASVGAPTHRCPCSLSASPMGFRETGDVAALCATLPASRSPIQASELAHGMGHSSIPSY